MERKFKIENKWITKAGLEACCVLIANSHRCGYVRLPKGHKYYRANYDDIPCEVHGGLTYGKSGDVGNFSESTEDQFWVGFDCAHYGDGLLSGLFGDFPVRSQSFVQEECEKLAHQMFIPTEEEYRSENG